MSFFHFFKEDTKESMMRLNFFIISVVCGIVLLSIATYIIITALKCKSTIDWSGMGVFVTGIGAIITGISYNKWKQKQIEIDNKMDNEEKIEK